MRMNWRLEYSAVASAFATFMRSNSEGVDRRRASLTAAFAGTAIIPKVVTDVFDVERGRLCAEDAAWSVGNVD